MSGILARPRAARPTVERKRAGGRQRKRADACICELDIHIAACRRNRLLDRELKNQPPQLAQDRRSRLGPPLEVDQKTPKTCAKGFLRQAPSPFYGLSRQRVPNARQGIRKACVAEEIADARRCAYWAGKTLARSVPWGESGGSLSIGRSSAIMALQGQAPPRWARPGTGVPRRHAGGTPPGKCDQGQRGSPDDVGRGPRNRKPTR